MARYFFMLVCLCFFTACERVTDQSESPDPLGDFALGYSVVVAPHPVAGPMSRPATDDEWIAAVKKALDQQFDRYKGDKLYHIAVSVDGYMLARLRTHNQNRTVAARAIADMKTFGHLS